MINPKELQLGNRIINDTYKTTIPLSPNDLERCSNSKGNGYSALPLTKHILKKMGFTLRKSDGLKWYEMIVPSQSGLITFFEGEKNGYCEIVIDIVPEFRVRNVHEVQNWYQLLTGKELKF